METLVERLIKIVSYSVVLALFTLPIILLYHSLPILKANSITQLLFSDWEPENLIYGLRNFIITSLIISTLSTIFSFIFSLPTALYIYSSRNRLSRSIYGVVKVMSGIPTIAYGFIGVSLLVPIIREYTDSPTGLSLLSTSIMLSVLITPTIIFYIKSSFDSLPKKIVNGALSLGSTKEQFYLYILIPSSIRGIIISLILGFSRAISDTMLAIMLSGNSFAFPSSVYRSARALTAHIALIIPGEFDSTEFKALFFIALILIVIIFIFNLFISLLKRVR